MKTQQTNEHIRKQVHAYTEACNPTPATQNSLTTKIITATPAHLSRRSETNAEASDNRQTSHSPLPWEVTPHTIRRRGVSKAQIYSEPAAVQVAETDSTSDAIALANAAFIVRACNEYEALKEELAVAKSQIENHDATLAQVRLNERHNAQRLADALKELIGEYWCNKGSRKNEFIACITPNTIPAYWRRADKALAQWNESPADADALEALDQLEQLEGGE